MPTNLVFLDAATMGDADLSPLQQAACNLQLYDYTAPEDRLARLQHADIAIVNKCVIDAKLIKQLPNLKAIMITATGTDNVDLVAAENAGIIVKNVQNYAETAVPQHVFALLLSLTNQLLPYQQAVKNGQWAQSNSFCLLDYPIMELSGKTMTIVGYGALGQATARLAAAFGMTVVIAERLGAEYVRPGRMRFCEALKVADVVSLHCPLTRETQHLFNMERLSWLKPSAILINTARGGLIDAQALLHALQQGQLKAAGLDVLAEEPPSVDNCLISCNLSNLLITPHIGWASHEARIRMLSKISAYISEFVAQKMDN